MIGKSTWSEVPLKFLYSIGKGLSITKANLIESGFPVISYGQVHAKDNQGTTVNPKHIRFVGKEDIDESSLVYKNGFIFADTSEDLDGCGNAVFIDTDNPIYAGYHTVVLNAKDGSDKKYFAYLFRTDEWRYQIRRQLTDVKLYSISQKVLKDTKVLFPPLHEQSRIAAFLDERCAKIDEAVARHKTLIEKLDEYRKAVITKAVTKGVRGEREMKESGVDWIGQIPVEWKSCRNKFLLLGTYSGGTPKSSEKEFYDFEGIPFVSIGDMSSVSFVIDTKSKLTPVGTIIYSMYATIGAVSELGIEATLNQAMIALFHNKKVVHEYFKYALMAAKSYVYSLTSASTQANLNAEIVRNIPLPLPSSEEQSEIVAFLDKKCAAIDSAKERHQQLISKLEEYKKSLIYNAVTGKIEC